MPEKSKTVALRLEQAMPQFFWKLIFGQKTSLAGKEKAKKMKGSLSNIFINDRANIYRGTAF